MRLEDQLIESPASVMRLINQPDFLIQETGEPD